MNVAAKLNAKQAMFVKEYLVDLNATQAAIRAGYSPKTAASQASDLLRNPKVSAEVQRGVAERQQRVEVKADTVLRELLRIATVDLGAAYDDQGNLLPVKEMPEDVRRAISGIKVFEEFDGVGQDRVKVGEVREVKFWDKPRSLELLGRHLQLFVDRLEHTGKDGGPIRTDSPTASPPLSLEMLQRLRVIADKYEAAKSSEGAGGGGAA